MGSGGGGGEREEKRVLEDARCSVDMITARTGNVYVFLYMYPPPRVPLPPPQHTCKLAGPVCNYWIAVTCLADLKASPRVSAKAA
jgi:hypothetical protein